MKRREGRASVPLTGFPVNGQMPAAFRFERLMRHAGGVFVRLAVPVVAVKHWHHVAREKQSADHAAHDDNGERLLRLGADLG